MSGEVVLDQDAGFFKDDILYGLGLFRIATCGATRYHKYPDFRNLGGFGHIAGRLWSSRRCTGGHEGTGGRNPHSLQETSAA